jgi:hypothetical protein
MRFTFGTIRVLLDVVDVVKIALTKVCIFDADENHVRTTSHNFRTRE